jgi:hypothetical protein
MTRTIRSLVALSAAAIALASPTRQPPQGQTAPPAVSFGGDASGCGSAVTPGEAQRYLDILARGLPDRSQAVLPPPYCVPVAAHIVRRTNGTGGIPYSQYYQSIADANYYFQSTGIKFYTVSVDFIDSDFYYLGITTPGDIDALRSTNVVPGAINVYYTASLPGLCGISSFTFSAVQGIVMANGCSGVPGNPTTMPHEFGHYFDLFHTHETAFGFELVNGTNCAVAGDLLCDTPADPFLQEGVNIEYPACNYTGFDLDANGERYAPDESQIMSYTPFLCATNFSPQSQARAV